MASRHCKRRTREQFHVKTVGGLLWRVLILLKVSEIHKLYILVEGLPGELRNDR